MPTSRPAIHTITSSTELKRWYWTKAELASLAKQVGLPTTGSKDQLLVRLCAALDGHPAQEIESIPLHKPAAQQLQPPLSRATIIPAGQRSSQILRYFFEQEIGKQFHFDGFMRDYISHNAGKTLGDAIAYWYASREEAQRKQPIAKQFEYNTFLRNWHQAHPHSTRREAIAAWFEYRGRPRG